MGDTTRKYKTWSRSSTSFNSSFPFLLILIYTTLLSSSLLFLSTHVCYFFPTLRRLKNRPFMKPRKVQPIPSKCVEEARRPPSPRALASMSVSSFTLPCGTSETTMWVGTTWLHQPCVIDRIHWQPTSSIVVQHYQQVGVERCRWKDGFPHGHFGFATRCRCPLRTVPLVGSWCSWKTKNY